MPVLEPSVGSFLTDVHRDHGVDVHTDSRVVGAERSGAVSRLNLSDGTDLDVDAVVVALGTTPNTAWLEGSGIKVDPVGGVVCDETCRAVGVDGVLAVGDVATWPHRGLGEPVRVEHWSNAAEMARHAATALVEGRSEPFAPVPTFWSDQ
jgi:3-phenylpropionate/trans-cinnamate dioxygenase ferredoxin reductase subunit